MPHVFISAGEPSGDLHGANLARALRECRPDMTVSGFGGERMAAAAVDLLYPMAQLAVMGFTRIPAHVLQFRRLLGLADRAFVERRPDAVVVIDYPGFHWHLARQARRRGIPVAYFVPPQLWAWAGWRVRKMRDRVNHVLCSLPFEVDWYRRRGVEAHYLGHPYFDELTRQHLDPGFVAEQSWRQGPVIGLLPGSRNQELDQNLATLLSAAGRIHAARPDARFLVACFKPEHGRQVRAAVDRLRLPVEVHVGRTPEIIEVSRACVAVSGSVSLELLYRGTPSVVLYRTNRVAMLAARALVKCRYISLVNLLAGRELFPEFLSCRDESAGVAARVLHWLDDPAAHDGVCRELKALRQEVAQPGACPQAARFLCERVLIAAAREARRAG